MTISLEALAMSGTNFLEVGFDMEEWEQMDAEVPDHLLAEEEEEEEEKESKRDKTGYECSFQSYVRENKNGNERESVDAERYDLIAKCWSHVPLRFGMIIISTSLWLVMKKYRKIRSSFMLIICIFLLQIGR
ncbi:hypothetical protein PHJA_000628800 [Phtheirospermum japonicum]|uniref:Uncharacterized protein n=1 Tax=Phtheirospermum japonicum TaxID=374723 RepID=A0A830BAZ8_9LAMI|nr:hypothetical protein PHJA_000628800 [Phtheirospermum japonicum]